MLRFTQDWKSSYKHGRGRHEDGLFSLCIIRQYGMIRAAEVFDGRLRHGSGIRHKQQRDGASSFGIGRLHVMMGVQHEPQPSVETDTPSFHLVGRRFYFEPYGNVGLGDESFEYPLSVPFPPQFG